MHSFRDGRQCLRIGRWELRRPADDKPQVMVELRKEFVTGYQFLESPFIKRTFLMQKAEHAVGRTRVGRIGNAVAKLQETHREINIQHSAFAEFYIDLTPVSKAGLVL